MGIKRANVWPKAPGTGLRSWKVLDECYFPSLYKPNSQLISNWILDYAHY